MKSLHRFWVMALALAAAGCASIKQPALSARPFQFEKDTFAYANELVWEYSFDAATGHAVSRRREPKPDYSLHCFVVVRSARQFFAHARFDPSQPATNETAYRRLIDQVLSRSSQRISGEQDRVVVPGYADLRTFSKAHEALLKSECGRAWRSYVQRGNWRMVFPFSRHGQEHTARDLQSALSEHWPPLVHVVRFPSLAINHALLLFDCFDAGNEIHFAVYDPNDPDTPAILKFNRSSRTFFLPRNGYFLGGRVDVYEVYRDALH